jgi:hypothetical protein
VPPTPDVPDVELARINACELLMVPPVLNATSPPAYPTAPAPPAPPVPPIAPSAPVPAVPPAPPVAPIPPALPITVADPDSIYVFAIIAVLKPAIPPAYATAPAPPAHRMPTIIKNESSLKDYIASVENKLKNVFKSNIISSIGHTHIIIQDSPLSIKLYPCMIYVVCIERFNNSLQVRYNIIDKESIKRLISS